MFLGIDGKVDGVLSRNRRQHSSNNRYRAIVLSEKLFA